MLKIKKAFTLAEVLITLGIIGVVSAMTLPSLLSNYQTNALATKKELFEKRIEEAMNQMRVHERLLGYDTADEFLDEFSKYLKINERCDTLNLDSCFNSVIYNVSEEISIDDLKSKDTLVLKSKADDFPADNVGVIFADGASAILNYKNSGCDWLDPYDTKGDRDIAKACISMIYDVNAGKGANELGTDIYPINSRLGYFILDDLPDVLWDLGDTTIVPENTCDGNNSWDTKYTSALLASSSYTYADCTLNYWAGAKKVCSDAGKRLPTIEELTYLARYVYNDDTIDDFTELSVTMDSEKAADAGFLGVVNIDGAFRPWTSQEDATGAKAYYRRFQTNSTITGSGHAGYPYYKSWNAQVARCVQDN
ncbi:MAG: type II secretion system protein [Candidatus Gastranaerophilales bacterium]